MNVLSSFRSSAQKTFRRQHQLQKLTRLNFHQSLKTSNEQIYRPKTTSTLSPTLWLLGCMPILTFALGTWQVQRLKWKVNLIDELQEKLERPSTLLPKSIKCDSSFYLLPLTTMTHKTYLVPLRCPIFHSEKLSSEAIGTTYTQF